MIVEVCVTVVLVRVLEVRVLVVWVREVVVIVVDVILQVPRTACSTSRSSPRWTPVGSIS